MEKLPELIAGLWEILDIRVLCGLAVAILFFVLEIKIFRSYKKKNRRRERAASLRHVVHKQCASKHGMMTRRVTALTLGSTRDTFMRWTAGSIPTATCVK